MGADIADGIAVGRAGLVDQSSDAEIASGRLNADFCTFAIGGKPLNVIFERAQNAIPEVADGPSELGRA